jgi:hypothetical protein
MTTTDKIPNVSALDTAKESRHRWYYFKEAFSPAIVRHAITEASLPEKAFIYDPFSGSGTTVLTAFQSGFNGRGTEVNPFLRFVASAKVTSSRKAKLTKAFDRAFEGARSRVVHPLERFSTFSELGDASQKRGKWLFNSSVLRAFGGAWAATSVSEPAERTLTRLAVIASAMDVANAEKDGKCLRFKSSWKDLSYSYGDFRNALERRRDEMLTDCAETETMRAGSAAVRLGDSRGLAPSENFDLCVTSPPYLNSFDYTDVYRPELFLSGFVKSMDELTALRTRTLRSHVQTKWSSPLNAEYGQHYDEAMSRLKAEKNHLWNRRIPEMVQAYFEDMSSVFLNLRARAKQSASVWLVVSTSAYAGVEIPVDLILADVASRNGWFLREVTVLRYLRRVSGQQWHTLNDASDGEGPYLRESLVVLDAKPRAKSKVKRS